MINDPPPPASPNPVYSGSLGRGANLIGIQLYVTLWPLLLREARGCNGMDGNPRPTQIVNRHLSKNEMQFEFISSEFLMKKEYSHLGLENGAFGQCLKLDYPS